MKMESDERAVLLDVCDEINKGMHERNLYAALLFKGLIRQTLDGFWVATAAGKKINAQMVASAD